MFMMKFYMLIFMILMLIFLINYSMSMLKKKKFEKNLPFECGYNPTTKMNLPFSLPYYLIMLTFLIFDIEIVMLIPLIYFMKTLNSLYLFILMIFFLFTLMFTLILEWSMDLLKWMY
nr:TPA_asm: ND3 [Bombus trifasciatus]